MRTYTIRKLAATTFAVLGFTVVTGFASAPKAMAYDCSQIDPSVVVNCEQQNGPTVVENRYNDLTQVIDVIPILEPGLVHVAADFVAAPAATVAPAAAAPAPAAAAPAATAAPAAAPAAPPALALTPSAAAPEASVQGDLAYTGNGSATTAAIAFVTLGAGCAAVARARRRNATR